VSHTSPKQHPHSASSPLCPEGKVTMDGMAKHEREIAPNAQTASRADIWFVLILTGGASAFLQMWHATHSGSTAGIVDGIVGLVPAATAIGLSHAVVSHKAAAWLRVITVVVMLAFMAAAASASASVVQPVEMRDFNWVFSLALDAAELACVWLLLGHSERKAAESAAVVLAEKAAEEARTEAAEAAGKVVGLEAELARVSADLTAVSATAEALRSAVPRSPAKRSRKPSASARGSDDTQDMTTELRAMQMLDAHPDLKQKGMGSELARRLGVHASYGRKLHARLTSEERPDSALAKRGAGALLEGAPEHVQERSE
jgi:hypothetical protein